MCLFVGTELRGRQKDLELDIRVIQRFSAKPSFTQPTAPFNATAALGQLAWTGTQLAAAAWKTSSCPEPRFDLIHFTTSRSLLTFVLRLTLIHDRTSSLSPARESTTSGWYRREGEATRNASKAWDGSSGTVNMHLLIC